MIQVHEGSEVELSKQSNANELLFCNKKEFTSCAYYDTIHIHEWYILNDVIYIHRMDTMSVNYIKVFILTHENVGGHLIIIIVY